MISFFCIHLVVLIEINDYIANTIVVYLFIIHII